MDRLTFLRRRPAIAAGHRAVITAAKQLERASQYGLPTTPALSAAYDDARQALAAVEPQWQPHRAPPAGFGPRRRP